MDMALIGCGCECNALDPLQPEVELEWSGRCSGRGGLFRLAPKVGGHQRNRDQ